MQTNVRPARDAAQVHASYKVPSTGLCLSDFEPDAAWNPRTRKPIETARNFEGIVLIDGVEVTPLRMHGDHRGGLVELLTTRDHTIDPIVHVYQVYAAPGSVRAWVYHEHQDDRLAFTAGDFLIVLFDIRPDSPTRDMITTLRVGVAAPTLLRIPRLVIHGVKNCGAAGATFVNLPTNIYLPEAPDKRRLPIDDPRVPYKFD